MSAGDKTDEDSWWWQRCWSSSAGLGGCESEVVRSTAKTPESSFYSCEKGLSGEGWGRDLLEESGGSFLPAEGEISSWDVFPVTSDWFVSQDWIRSGYLAIYISRWVLGTLVRNNRKINCRHLPVCSSHIKQPTLDGCSDSRNCLVFSLCEVCPSVWKKAVQAMFFPKQ